MQRPDLIGATAEVYADRIGVLGTSFGGAIATYTAGVDERVSAIISACGSGDGARKLRGQHPSDQARAKFYEPWKREGIIAAGPAGRFMMNRFEIVLIPPHLRGGLAANAGMEFPVETAQSIFDFRPDDDISNIGPRPLCFACCMMEQALSGR